jgi:hypothetical protein
VVAEDSWFPSIREVFSMLTTFALTVLAWIFFRAENVGHAVGYIRDIFTKSIVKYPNFSNDQDVVFILLVVLGFFLIEWMGRRGKYAIENSILYTNKISKYAFYYILIGFIWWYIGGEQQEFIYFQF